MSTEDQRDVLPQTPTEVGMARLLLAFRSRGYRWLWVNGLLRGFGMVMGMLAQSWLILELTDTGAGGSPFWVGTAAGVTGLVILCTAPLGGWVADRFDRRGILLALEALTFSTSVLLAVLIFVDLVQLWHAVAIAVARGLSMSMAMPARSTLTYDLVGRSALLNATAANFTSMSITRVLGPAIAGVVISTRGVEWCYLLVAGTSLLGAWTLLPIPLTRPALGIGVSTMWQQLRESLSLVLKPGLLRSLLLMSPIVEVFGFSYQIMLPVMARDVLHVGAAGLGVLGSAAGVGSLIGALSMVGLGDIRAKGLLVVSTSAAFGLFLLLFALSPWLYLSAALIALAAGVAATYDVNTNTLLQSLAPEDARGRVMGMLVFTYGMSPLGGFQAGMLASLWSAPFALGLGGALLMLNGLRMAPLVRHIRAWESQPGGVPPS